MGSNEARYRDAEARYWESLDLEPSEQRLELDDGTGVRMQRVGSGPPLLFVHGGSAAGTNWAPLVARLPDRCCLLLDRPACGLSDSPPPRTSIASFNRAADRLLAQVLDAAGFDSVDVVATSLGAYYAFRSAAHTPERVERLVSLGYPFGASTARLPWSMRAAAIPGMAQLSSRLPPTKPAIRMILRQLGMGPALADGRIPDEMVEWFQSLLRDTPTMRAELRAAPSLAGPLRGQHPEAVLSPEVLGGVAAPTLLLWGADDPIGGASTAEAFAPLLPSGELIVLDTSSHAPWVDDPATCAHHIEAFLAR